MTVTELAQRVATLERELADLKEIVVNRPKPRAWESTVGMFADSPEFDEAVRLGREYRDQANRESLENTE